MIIKTPETMNIKILGTGCANCKRLEANARQAVSQLGVDAEIEKIEDINEIVGYGIMRTPGLMIDGEVVASGRVPDVPDIVTLLASAQ